MHGHRRRVPPVPAPQRLLSVSCLSEAFCSPFSSGREPHGQHPLRPPAAPSVKTRAWGDLTAASPPPPCPAQPCSQALTTSCGAPTLLTAHLAWTKYRHPHSYVETLHSWEVIGSHSSCPRASAPGPASLTCHLISWQAQLLAHDGSALCIP